MGKTLSREQDPLIQFRVSKAELAKMSKIAEGQTRTLPNWVKSVILDQLKGKK